MDDDAIGLLRSSLSRNPDLVLVGDRLILTPVLHVELSVQLERNSMDQRYRARRKARPLYLARDWARDESYIGSIETKRGRALASFAGDAPSDALDQIIEDAVEFMRPAATFPGYHAFALRHSGVAFDPGIHFILELAMGNIDAAWILMRWHRGKRFDCERTTLGFVPDNDLQVRTLCEMLDAGDLRGIAANLHEAEAQSVQAQGLKHFWKQLPFPIEDRGA